MTQDFALTHDEMKALRRLCTARKELIDRTPVELRASWLGPELEALEGALKVLKWKREQ